jgi:peptidoglycan/xylan/chitin deacetylase (PgdA/CDA1 family)
MTLIASSISVLSLTISLTLAQQAYPPPLVSPPTIPEWTRSLKVDSASPAVTADRCIDANSWALTYDDGPSGFTSAVVDGLTRAGVKGTFFVTGNSLLKYSEPLKKAYTAGHEIALHSWSHVSFNNLTDDQIVTEVYWNAKLVKDIIGVTPVLFRPPFGEANARVLQVLGALGIKSVVLWNRDSNDWSFSFFPEKEPSLPYAKNDTPEAIVRSFREWTAITPRQGTISLQHDVFELPSRQIEGAASVVAQSQYKAVTVSQCLGIQAYDEDFLKKFDKSLIKVDSTFSQPSGSGKKSAAAGGNASTFIAKSTSSIFGLVFLIGFLIFWY